MSTTKIEKAEDVFMLPQGGLVVSCFQVSLCRETVFEAASLLLEKKDVAGLETQAEAVHRAGHKYGFGAKKQYRLMGGSAASDADLPKDKSSAVLLCTPRDALRLPEGRLAGGSIEVSFGETDVLECAKLLIKQGQQGPFVSQAGVIAAGGKLGWGMGDVYTTL